MKKQDLLVDEFNLQSGGVMKKFAISNVTTVQKEDASFGIPSQTEHCHESHHHHLPRRRLTPHCCHVDICERQLALDIPSRSTPESSV